MFYAGRNRQEDVVGALRDFPSMNEYWSSKRADMTRITVPAYVLASYSTFLHTFGSFRGFAEIPHSKKWYALVYLDTSEANSEYNQGYEFMLPRSGTTSIRNRLMMS
jgi:hypothetical protein